MKGTVSNVICMRIPFYVSLLPYLNKVCKTVEHMSSGSIKLERLESLNTAIKKKLGNFKNYFLIEHLFFKKIIL